MVFILPTASPEFGKVDLQYQDASPAENAVRDDPPLLTQTLQGAPGIATGHSGCHCELSKRGVAIALFIRCFSKLTIGKDMGIGAVQVNN